MRQHRMIELICSVSVTEVGVTTASREPEDLESSPAAANRSEPLIAPH
jgi:hypothetical protein